VTLRKARFLAGYKIKEIAEMLGVTRVTVYNWEEGHTEPSFKILKQLARLYSIDLNELEL